MRGIKMRCHSFSFLCRALFFVATILLLCLGNPYAADIKSTFNIESQIDALDQQVRRARIMMDIGNTSQALITLRAASANSWKILYDVSGKNYASNTDPISSSGTLGRAAQAAAQAHYWWGMAARKSNSNDESITAFARAARLNPSQSNTDISLNFAAELKRSLQAGFPYSAAPDVLHNITQFAYSDVQIKSTFVETSASKSTFLYTEGTLPTPSQMPQVAPLYRNIPANQLPDKLRSSHILYIYSQPQDKGLATLQVMVRYNDLKHAPLAAQLAQTMAQIKLANDQLLKRTLPPITLWLETVSANWPNTPGENVPWEAAAKIDSSPHDIMVFRIDQHRSNLEWFRELQHEYGHVAWPNFANFAPPLEPNANGLIAETIAMLWQDAPAFTNKDISNEANQHIQQNAFSALQQWLQEGPPSQLQHGNNGDSLHYLQGLCVYIERVYGRDVFCNIFGKLYTTNNDAKTLLSQFTHVLTAQENGTRNIYLPAACTTLPTDIGAFVRKSTVIYKSDTTREFLLYIPSGTQQLVIPWQGAGQIQSKSTFGDATAKAQELTININDTAGWQKLILHFDGDVSLGMATLN